MPRIPIEIRSEIAPSSRFDLIDIREQAASHSGTLQAFPQILYCSFHTTAGFLDQSLISRLTQPRHGVHSYIRFFQRLFPEGAGYQHDDLPLRQELSESQRRVEPRNGDAHLTFICSGMSNNVNYVNQTEAPIFLIDLDGVGAGGSRRRVTSIIAYNDEEVVARELFSIPAPSQAITTVNLKDTCFGIYRFLYEQIDLHRIGKGRVHIRLTAKEHHARLMVNEYEPLLMRDLIEVLHDPLRFAPEQDHHPLDKGWIGLNTANNAQYSFARVLDEGCNVPVMKSLPKKSSIQMNNRGACRMAGLKRSISLLVTDQQADGHGAIVDGAFQSPIMIQWTNGNNLPRMIEVMLTRFA